MPTLTFAELVAPAAIDTAADPVAALAAARLAKKATLYADLDAVGVIGTVSWTTGSVPSSLLETYSWSLTDYDIAQAYIAQGALNPVATGDALTTLADQVYDNQRGTGHFTTARVLLTDAAGAGPWVFQPDSVSFSVGSGGLLFNGFDFTGLGALTLPRGGTVYVYVQSEAAGGAYSALAVNAVNFFARGSLPGTTVANDATWLTFAGAVVGTDDETDATLQARDQAKWGTLGTGSPQAAYQAMAFGADPTVITRVAVFTNLDLLDPGRVDVIIAGPAGALGPDVVLLVQNAIAPLQTGGDKIPETARAVATSAANHTVTVSATVYVQASYNTAAFQAQVAADYAAFAGAVEIGGGPLGVVSAERLLEVLTYRAGLAPGVIYDVNNFSPATDTPLVYNEVPVVALALTYVSV